MLTYTHSHSQIDRQTDGRTERQSVSERQNEMHFEDDKVNEIVYVAVFTSRIIIYPVVVVIVFVALSLQIDLLSAFFRSDRKRHKLSETYQD